MRKFILALTVCLLATAQFGRPANAGILAATYGVYLVGGAIVASYLTYKTVKSLDAHFAKMDLQ